MRRYLVAALAAVLLFAAAGCQKVERIEGGDAEKEFLRALTATAALTVYALEKQTVVTVGDTETRVEEEYSLSKDESGEYTAYRKDADGEAYYAGGFVYYTDGNGAKRKKAGLLREFLGYTGEGPGLSQEEITNCVLERRGTAATVTFSLSAGSCSVRAELEGDYLTRLEVEAVKGSAPQRNVRITMTYRNPPADPGLKLPDLTDYGY